MEMALSKKDMGQLIKKAREHKSKIIGEKYTGDMLAKDIQYLRSYIGDIESGRGYPNYILLNKIAEACEVPFSFFEGVIKEGGHEMPGTSTPQNDLKEIIKEAVKEAIQETLQQEPKATLTILECAKYTGIGKDKLMELAHSSKSDFPAFKVGKKFLINRELLNKWLEKISMEGRTL